MSQQITITSVTANTPVDIYYCDSMSASCVYVATVATFPYVFDVPIPYCDSNFLIKIVDTLGCEYGEFNLITPTPTPNVTSTMTPTPTQTPTNTLTPSPSVSPTATNTPTPSITPSITPSPSSTPNVAYHNIGQNKYDNVEACVDTITYATYYTYISEANTVPVIGATVYTVEYNGTLYSPYNGENKDILMIFGTNYYGVRIDSSGKIVDFTLCP